MLQYLLHRKMRFPAPKLKFGNAVLICPAQALCFDLQILNSNYMGVSENGVPQISILIGFSIITIHFGVPLFLETPYVIIVAWEKEKKNEIHRDSNHASWSCSVGRHQPRLPMTKLLQPGIIKMRQKQHHPTPRCPENGHLMIVQKWI